MKKYLLLTLYILFLFGCTEDVVKTMSGSTDGEIRMRMGIGSVESATRGEGVINDSFTQNLSVSFVRFDATNQGSTYGTGSLVNATILPNVVDNVVFQPSQYYLTSGYNTKLTGLYPRVDGVNAIWDMTNQKISFRIDGSTDIMCSNTIEGNKDNKSLNRLVTFSHVLTQIQLHIYASDALTADVWGKVETIKIANRESAITYTLSATGEGVFTPDGSNRDDLPVTFIQPNATDGITIPVSANGNGTDVAPVGYVMFAPVTDASHELLIYVKMKDGYETSLRLSGKEWKAGVSYGVYLKFDNAVEISSRVTIQDWNDVVVDDEIPIV